MPISVANLAFRMKNNKSSPMNVEQEGTECVRVITSKIVEAAGYSIKFH